eukprot:Plantae.Rhodophyta-Purpureofilum_apyrenoidigerum.ctg11628.p1 GENE.Plantae.Rhodophyta-Purpureofilum_apyrenoidigerum.ctg11628~~Plantae.Rhodophyta-Purpureofilum_apyrenoidigerum.ctg11628.p1  ORF type:complete len:244 (+),score=39.30 Plantae.Rhodophyta-Purpureofilum_apyrenoidigerum.ctg11628:46-732(+)
MWSAEVPPHGAGKRSELEWYQKAKEYWKTQEASEDGMLGGYGNLSSLDIETSSSFLKSLPGVDFSRHALDVGAGIGRVSRNLLLPLFALVDMLEADAVYVKQSNIYVADERLERRICCPMEDFKPEKGKYSVIWIQWCIIYLTDADLISFIRACAEAVAPNGYVCIKDNVCSKGFVVDKSDSSVTRSERYLQGLLDEAGVAIVKICDQHEFPKELFPVKMYALRLKSI